MKQGKIAMFVGFVTLLGAISGCATMAGSAGVNWAAQNPGAVPEIEDAKLQAADAIREALKDPGSAQFKNWTPFFKNLYNYGLAGAGHYEPLWQLCVEVNAKNSFGGYTGYKWMYVKFRDGKAVRDSLGVGEGSYDCLHGPQDPDRRAPG